MQSYSTSKISHHPSMMQNVTLSQTVYFCLHHVWKSPSLPNMLPWPTSANARAQKRRRSKWTEKERKLLTRRIASEMATAKAQALACELKARVRQPLPFLSNGVMGNRVRVKAWVIRGLVQAFVDYEETEEKGRTEKSFYWWFLMKKWMHCVSWPNLAANNTEALISNTLM